MKKIKGQYRQGDVLVNSVKNKGTIPVPKDVEEIKRDGGKVILAYGEKTGHSHAILEPDAKMVKSKSGNERFLQVEAPVPLDHQEHDAIALENDDYMVVGQKEYMPEAIRSVQD